MKKIRKVFYILGNSNNSPISSFSSSFGDKECIDHISILDIFFNFLNN